MNEISCSINMNIVSYTLLKTLFLIEPTFIERIIEKRNEMDQFNSAEDLILVKGFGKKR